MSERPEATQYSPPADLDRLRGTAFLIGGVATLAALAGAYFDLQQFSRSYLIAWLFWLGVAMGSLALLMLHHLTRGAWGIMVRRILEASSRTLPLLAILFLPIALRMEDIFLWAQPSAGADKLLAAKAWYLNVPFFWARAAAFFVIWGILVFALSRLSARQDETGDAKLFRKLQAVAAPGLVIYALTATFASVDWLMSLDPHWYSSLFGVYFIGGQAVAALSFVILVVAYLAARPPLAGVYRPQHFHDYGNLLMAFVLLWSYFAFSQFLIIWSGNLPEETAWFLARQHGPWRWVSLGLIVFHFAVPFALLLSRARKRDIRRLYKVPILLLIVHWIDLYWLAMPAFGHGDHHASPHWLDAATVIAVGGLWLAFFAVQLKKRALVPHRDPYFEEALDA